MNEELWILLREDAEFLKDLSKLLPTADWQMPHTGARCAEMAQRLDEALDDITPTVLTRSGHWIEDNGD